MAQLQRYIAQLQFHYRLQVRMGLNWSATAPWMRWKDDILGGMSSLNEEDLVVPLSHDLETIKLAVQRRLVALTG